MYVPINPKAQDAKLFLCKKILMAREGKEKEMACMRETEKEKNKSVKKERKTKKEKGRERERKMKTTVCVFEPLNDKKRVISLL